MSWVVAVAGWATAAWLLLRLRRRAALVADAEHELRGAASVIGLALDRASRTGFTAAIASLVWLQIDRMGAALADLPGARSGAVAPAALDAGRLAQVLANLIANAAEHGDGPVVVQSSHGDGAVRLGFRNPGQPDARAARPLPGRGRGLAIAKRAAGELGARVEVDARDGETVATVELPAGDLRRAA